MKKLQTITTSTAIALASVGAPVFAQEAQATSVPTDTAVNEPALVAKSQVKPLEKSEVPAPSTVKPALDAQKAVVKDAEAKIDTAKTGVQEKEATVASIETEYDNADKTVKDAETVASQVTPEKVAEVKDAQAKNLEAQTANQKATEATNADLAKEKEALSAEQAKVATANAKVAETAKDVKTAEQAVASAQSALDGTGLASAEKDLKQAQADVKEATKSVADAQTAKENASKADANRAQAIKSAETDVNTKNDAVKLAKDKLASATEHADSVESKLQSAQAELKSAQDKLANTGVDTVTIADLTQFKKDKAEGDSDFMTDSGATVIENSSTKISEADKNKIVDFNNITDEQKQELALYNLKVVNAIRKNLGLSELELNTGSMKAAQNQMNKYIARNKNILTHGHLSGDYFGENGGPIAFAKYGTSLSMYKVKQEIYNVVMSQAFADAPSKWGHSSNIQKSISDFGASFGIIDGELYSINVFGVYSGSKIKDEKDLVTLEKAVETAKSNLEQATTVSENAKNALTTASTDYASALSLKTEAEKVLADAMATPLQAQVAENNLRLANIALENAKKRETQASEAVANFSASLADKKSALEKAQDALKEAKTVQTIASQALENVSAKLEDQETKLDNLNKQVTKLLAEKDALVKEAKELAETLQAYLDAPVVLANAKQARTAVSVKLELAKSDLEMAQSKLENLLTAQKAEEAKLAELEATYAKLVDLAEKAQENVVATLPDGTVIAVPKVAPTAETLPELNLDALVKEDAKDSIVKTLPDGTIVAVPKDAPVAEELPELNLEELAKEDAKDSTVKTLPDGTIVAVPKDAPVAEELPTVNVDELKKALDAGKEVTIDAQGNVVVRATKPATDEKPVNVDRPQVNNDKSNKDYASDKNVTIDNKGNVITKGQTYTSQQQASNKTTYSRVERAKTLPNTGESSSVAMLVLGAILGTFGLVTVRRKN